MNAQPPFAPRTAIHALAVAIAALAAPVAVAAPTQFLTVGDPIEEELRLLDLYPSAELRGRLKLPHLGTRPLQLFELQGTAGPVVGARPELAVSLARVERVLGRDATPAFAPDPAHPATPRLFQVGDEDQRVEASVGLEGTILNLKEDAGSAVVSGSGMHARMAVGFDRWLAYSHLVLGRFANGQQYADPIVTNTDIIVLTEETYLALTGHSGRWAASFGRGRWQWGPGPEGSLLLSRSAAPVTGMSLRGSSEGFRLTGTMINATLRQSAGEQLAAHRLEWQPFDGLRIGGSEAVRYHAPGWVWVYAVGVIPYAVASRLLHQDEPDSTATLRSNLLVAVDASWRIVPGHRIYGELAVDDLHAETSANPDKIAWQVGWEGAGMVAGRRVTWTGEVSRLWRYVYTSFFGRAYEAQDGPLGYPTGPDSRRIRVGLALDLSTDWQWSARAARTDQGENDLDEPYFPGTPRPDPSTFEGIVESTREVEMGVRWWPAGGVDLEVRGGWRRIDDRDHVPDATSEDWTAAFEVRLVR